MLIGDAGDHTGGALEVEDGFLQLRVQHVSVGDDEHAVEQPTTIAFDYAPDFELLEYLLRDAGQWDSVRDVVRPLNVDELASRFDGVLSAESAYAALRRRGLERHHALADALAEAA